MILKLFSIIILASFLFAGCGEKKDHEDNYNLDNEGPIEQGTADTTASDIVREGVIDVASIDENKDRHVYQCPMDWNVLSDNQGSCPVCNMNLERFTVTTARDNLQKNDFQVK